ncbi:MAG TPA: DEAD/DEAH box helicase family protein [Streptosporangiaceae bacterium]|nr:DEAD/DEAH box helicase family protein [Streptosporangiaceae bacterium]
MLAARAWLVQYGSRDPDGLLSRGAVARLAGRDRRETARRRQRAGAPPPSTASSRPLWPHQQRALDAFEKDRKRGDTSTYLVVPPGGGKTLVGLEALRRLGRPALVLCPNTAIQAQWIAQWHAAFEPGTVRATASRELPAALTVLTYQALCTIAHSSGDAAGPFLADNSKQQAGAGEAELLGLLHPSGRELIARLRDGGPWSWMSAITCWSCGAGCWRSSSASSAAPGSSA